jgi:CheY-like chemotaxis protein
MATVLLIEDDPAQRAMYRDLLYYNGYDVLLADDARMGVPLALEAHPDIIVMDVMLPGLNGLEATRQLSRHPKTTGIPIICMSGFPVSPDSATHSGARELLAKPVDPSTLIKSIWRHLGPPGRDVIPRSAH